VEEDVTDITSISKQVREDLKIYDTVAEMLADDVSLSEDDLVMAEGHRYIVAASDATNANIIQRSDNTKLLVQQGEQGFNAKAFGIKGDGTDENVAIQAFIDFCRGAGVAAYFPRGSYNVGTVGIDVSDPSGATTNLHMVGDGHATHIYGSVLENAIIRRLTIPNEGGGQGLRLIEKLRVTNNAKSGTGASKGIEVFKGVGINMLRDLYVRAETGIEIQGFTASVQNCRIEARFPDRTGFGISLGPNFSASGLDVTGFGDGVRVWGPAGALSGCRIEICNTGLVIGKNDVGNPVIADRCSLSGLSFEANNTGIEFFGGFYGTLSGVAIQGSSNAPSGQSSYGIRCTGTIGTIQDVRMLGNFDVCCIELENVGTGRLINIEANNTFSDKPDWLANYGDLGQVSFQGCNFDPASVQTSNKSRNIFNVVTTNSLQQYDVLESKPTGRNLCDTNVAVANAATSVAIAFPPATSADNAQINDASSGVQSGGSLDVDETYYYIGTLVTRYGESGQNRSRMKNYTTSSGNQTIDIEFFGGRPAGSMLRLYRGTDSTGTEFDGYWDLSGTTFTDDGTVAFTQAAKSPAQENVSGTSGQEPDANYGVIVTPSWETTVWITSKATSGFTVNFGTAAPDANQTVDWLLMR
jgi:hypothetical protein